MSKRAVWGPRLLAATAVLTWALANGVDVLSMLFLVQIGGVAFPSARLRPAEFFLVYAGFRLLGAIAVGLAIVFVTKHWPAVRSAAWSALTAFSLVTAVTAWLRLYE
jgi:hypothetical protein